MTRVTIAAAILFAAACLLSIPPRLGHRPAFAFSFAPPLGATGAPGEITCQGCHTSTGGNGSIAITGVPEHYSPGQTYTLTVTLQDPGQQRWGFELTALQFDAITQAPERSGTLIDTSVHTLLSEDAGTQRQYITHTSNEVAQGDPDDGTFWGTPDGPVSWSFDWTAPAAGAGIVIFYVAGNAANGNGINGTGDFMYKTSVSSNELPPTPVTRTTWGKIKKMILE